MQIRQNLRLKDRFDVDSLRDFASARLFDCTKRKKGLTSLSALDSHAIYVYPIPVSFVVSDRVSYYITVSAWVGGWVVRPIVD